MFEIPKKLWIRYGFVVLSEWTELRHDEFRQLGPTSYWLMAGMMISAAPMSNPSHIRNYFNSIIISNTYEYVPKKYIHTYYLFMLTDFL